MRKLNITGKQFILLLLLGFVNGIMYSFPYIRYVFYDQQIAAMGITNAQSGFMMTLESGTAIFFYIFGGIIADKFSTKKCLITSMLGSVVLIFFYIFTMQNYTLSCIVWLLLGFSTNFVFWCALTKAVRQTGGDDSQGRSYGIYYASSGIWSALINALALTVYSKFSSNVVFGFKMAVLTFGIGTVVAVLLVGVFFKEKKDANGKTVVVEQDESEKFHIRDVLTAVKMPQVWMISLLIFISYGLYTTVNYFTPYLTDVMKVPTIDSSAISIVRSNLMCLFSIVGGFLADKIFKSTLRWFVCGMSIAAVLYIVFLTLPHGINSTFATILSLFPAAVSMMLYGVVFSIMNESNIPKRITGTVIGVASVIGYLPDAIYSFMFGKWMDTYKNTGYNYIFLFLMSTAVVGIVFSIVLYRMVKKQKAMPTASNS
jgi:nitrate/nitrite transporter NarK